MLNVDAMRRRLLTSAAVPQEILEEAFKATKDALRANETKFFTFRGRVVNQQDVANHDARLRAADQVYSIAGLYARERDQKPSAPAVALEVDPITGVVRIIVGAVPADKAGDLEPADSIASVETAPIPLALEAPTSEVSKKPWLRHDNYKILLEDMDE